MKKNIDNASKTILDIFENTAVIHGKRLAAKDPVRELTYGELFEQAQRMAAEVGEILYPEEDGEVETGFPIAILAEKSCSELAAVLASIYAGSFYVCINPEQT